jgi:hypothetical protein
MGPVAVVLCRRSSAPAQDSRPVRVVRRYKQSHTNDQVAKWLLFGCILVDRARREQLMYVGRRGEHGQSSR